MLLTTNSGSIVSLKKMKGITFRDDINDPRDPAINFIMLNNSGTQNQFGAWDQLALPFIEKGQAVPAGVQDVIAGLAPGIKGAVNPSTLQWDLTLSPVLVCVDQCRRPRGIEGRIVRVRVVGGGLAIDAVRHGADAQGDDLEVRVAVDRHGTCLADRLVVEHGRQGQVPLQRRGIDRAPCDAGRQTAMTSWTPRAPPGPFDEGQRQLVPRAKLILRARVVQHDEVDRRVARVVNVIAEGDALHLLERHDAPELVVSSMSISPEASAELRVESSGMVLNTMPSR